MREERTRSGLDSGEMAQSGPVRLSRRCTNATNRELMSSLLFFSRSANCASQERNAMHWQGMFFVLPMVYPIDSDVYVLNVLQGKTHMLH